MPSSILLSGPIPLTAMAQKECIPSHPIHYIKLCKKMLFLFRLIFHLFCAANWMMTAFSVAQSTKKCGKYSIELLQMPVYYKPYRNTKPLQLKISGQNDQSNESAALVSVGYALAQNGSAECVAVKLIGARNKGHHGTNVYAKSRDVMHKIQQNLRKDERQYLIEMFDAGYTTPYGEGAIIMELGEQSFGDRLYARTAHYGTDAAMLNAIYELAQPLVEFHRVAIHMDVNPNNYLYVLDNNGQLVLKLIDFDGAQFIRRGSNQNESVSSVGPSAFTREYTAPEHYDTSYGQVSTKSDVWSVGMIAFEILVDRLRFEEGLGSMNGTERMTMLCNIGNLFLGFKRNRFGDFPGPVKDVLLVYSESRDWVWQNSEAILTVLQLWLRFPRTAFLVTNLLHVEQEKRLTAQGILDFINGLCLYNELKIVRDPKELRIFNSLRFGEFKKILEKIKSKNKIKFWRSNWQKANKTYKMMKKMVKEVVEVQQMLIDQMGRSVAMQFGDCETAEE